MTLIVLMKAVDRRLPPYLSKWILTLLIAMAFALPLAAQDAAVCAQLGDFRLTAEEVATIQENLIALDLKPGVVDGLMGPETRSGINQFCVLTRATVEREGDAELTSTAQVGLTSLIAAYRGLVGSRHNEDWRMYLQDDAFHTWVEQDEERAKRMRKSGTTDQILEIMDAWYALLNSGAKKPEAPKPAPTPKTLSEMIHEIPTGADKEVSWKAAPRCPCLRDFSKTKTYGFFRFWDAAKPADLDFSVFSRIGYFAVPLDDGGIGVKDKGHWELAKSQFINVARRYNTQVDLVIYNDNWDQWTSSSDLFVHRLADQIASMVTEKITNDTLNRAIPYISLGTDEVPSMGDGVTLFLDFSTSPPPAGTNANIFANLVTLIADLRKQLGPERNVNVLLQMRDFVSETPMYVLSDIDQILHDVDLVLVLLDQKALPTSDSQKVLRTVFEEEFPDAQSERDILRKVLPVIDPDEASLSKEKDGLKDDLVYFEDNFGGVGFLPMPLAANTKVSQELVAEFFDDRSDSSWDPFGHSDTRICRFVCPRSWQFLAAFYLLLFSGIIAAILWLGFVDFRIFLARFPRLPWVWGILLLAIGLALLCDKTFSGRRDETIGLFVISALIFFAVRRTQKKREAEYP